MVKMNRHVDMSSQDNKHEKSESWLTRLFRSKNKEEEELTFETKHKKAKQVDKKKVALYFIVGFMVVSSLGAIAVPLIQNLQAPEPEQHVQADKVLDDNAINKLNANRKDVGTTPVGEDTNKKDEDKDSDKKDNDKSNNIEPTDNQDTINKKVQEELDKATTKVVAEYNKKLEDATSRVQNNNVELATAKAEKEALQKQVDELKQQLEEAKQGLKQESKQKQSDDDRLALPGQ